MGYIDDGLQDDGLADLDTLTENLYITSQEAATYAEAQTTYKLGTKATPTVSVPEDGDVSGRKVVITAITDGVVDATGDATHWALTDNSASRLLAAGALAGTVGVTATNTFTLTEFDIEFPDPA